METTALHVRCKAVALESTGRALKAAAVGASRMASQEGHATKFIGEFAEVL
jgi:hypothetical protein